MGVTRSNACRLATPNSVHDYCCSFRLSVRRTALLGEYSVKVEAPDYTLLFIRVGPDGAERQCASRLSRLSNS